MCRGAHRRDTPRAAGLQIARGPEPGDVRGTSGGHRRLLPGATGSHLGEGPRAGGDAHARGGRGDRRVVVEHGQGERLEDDRFGERALDGEHGRAGKVQLALPVPGHGSGERVVLEPPGGRGIHDALIAQVPQLVVAEAEIPDEVEQAAGAGDDPEPPPR